MFIIIDLRVINTIHIIFVLYKEYIIYINNKDDIDHHKEKHNTSQNIKVNNKML